MIGLSLIRDDTLDEDSSIGRLIFGEGYCRRCGELKTLAMVRMNRGGAIGRRDPLTGRLIAFPRVGYCYECAVAEAKAGSFSRKRKKKAGGRAAG